ncbi:MAG: hypothetical protein QOE51_4016 [Actinoplanes sp.]|nr:hypothetical protein [Actinoplanes sp.]
MSERGTASGLHMHISKLLVVCVVGAIAATSSLIVELLVGMPEPPPGPGPNGLPPPPPELLPLAVFTVLTGLFVLAWLAVLVVFSRDQILARVHRGLSATVSEAGSEQVGELLAKLRVELAADREREMRVLDERLAEYGERRETDGYLHGMRVATGEDATVHAIRRSPPQR